MVWIPGGCFSMGSDAHYPEEAPAHRVRVGGFWIDRAPVTNAQFLKFVKATGHVTLAEQTADPALYPGALPELLAPASIVFVPPPGPVGTGDHYRWWQYVKGADWRHPEGPGSSIRGREHHPVVHVAHRDAAAYAAWAGKALPSEAEWERAARGGLEASEFAWGEELHPGGVPMANTFQGDFPHHNSRFDGWERTSPVGSFPANGYGLLDMIGNVWEWTDDWYADHGATVQKQKQAGGCCTIDNPRGGGREASIDEGSQHGTIPRKVVKGGSFLCAPSYCRRYRPAARMAQGIDTSTCHLGFRCIVRPALAESAGR
ncbi:MAG: gliding motility-associated lipoprotein GldK [Cyanobium sp. CACIAM 14]|nr:MAG: gliding motility-associated lipoprotein GldK [Cyanobium sp. CACIAM 14]